jgi:hypothetical protein
VAEPEFRRDTEDGRGKFYDHPLRTDENGQPRKYESVTTVLQVYNKDGLKWWASKIAARRAMENLPKLLRASRIDPCNRSWHRDDSRCGECITCVERWVDLFHVGESSRRAREGSGVHRVIEWWSKTGKIHYERQNEDDPTWDDIKIYIDRFMEWVRDYGLSPGSWKLCETTVYNHKHGYAGTLDGHLLIEPTTAKAAKFCARVNGANNRDLPDGPDPVPLDTPVLMTFDAKSREGDGKAFFDEHALQLAPYRWAETALPRGSAVEFELPRTDGGAIFQPRLDGYTFEPVVTDARVFQTFLQLLQVYRTVESVGASWTRNDSFPVPEGWKYKARLVPPPPKLAAGTGTPTGEPDAEEIADAVAGRAAKKVAPRKRAAKKKQSTLASIVGTQPVEDVMRTGAPRPAHRTEWTDETIPF